jgi:hypothetical protein
MNKISAVVIYCVACDKPTYISAVNYHAENPCFASRQGWDCMEFENENAFCDCVAN